MGRRKTVLEKGKVEENNQPTLVQRSIDKNWNILYKANLRVEQAGKPFQSRKKNHPKG